MRSKTPAPFSISCGSNGESSWTWRAASPGRRVCRATPQRARTEVVSVARTSRQPARSPRASVFELFSSQHRALDDLAKLQRAQNARVASGRQTDKGPDCSDQERHHDKVTRKVFELGHHGDASGPAASTLEDRARIPPPGRLLRCTPNRLGKCSGNMQLDRATREDVILTTAAGLSCSPATGWAVRIRVGDIEPNR
jgi:hypothetical protein